MLLIIAATIITGGIFFSPSPKNIKGTWRVQSAKSNCADQIIRIRMDHGIWKSTTDLPALGRYDIPIQNIDWENDSLIIETPKGPLIKVQWSDDSTMKGTIYLNERVERVKLSKQ